MKCENNQLLKEEWDFDLDEILDERDYFLENSPEDIAEDLEIPFDLSDFDLSII